MLAFRHQVQEEADMDLDYRQNDLRAVETIFVFENEDPLVQELGSVVTKVCRS